MNYASRAALSAAKALIREASAAGLTVDELLAKQQGLTLEQFRHQRAHAHHRYEVDVDCECCGMWHDPKEDCPPPLPRHYYEYGDEA